MDKNRSKMMMESDYISMGIGSTCFVVRKWGLRPYCKEPKNRMLRLLFRKPITFAPSHVVTLKPFFFLLDDELTLNHYLRMCIK